NVVGVIATCYFLLNYFVRERDRAAELVAAERERSERLLLNVLPEPIAERLKAGESLIADGSPEVGVLFADITGFTPMSATMAPGGYRPTVEQHLHPLRRLGMITGWRRSRRSATRTWWPPDSSADSPITSRSSRSWHSACRALSDP